MQKNVGPSTDKKLRTMFNNLHEGILDKRHKTEHPVCEWVECGCSEKFFYYDSLNNHIVSNIPSQSDVAPLEKTYSRSWKDRSK